MLPTLSTASHLSGSGSNTGFVLKSVPGCALRDHFLHDQGRTSVGNTANHMGPKANSEEHL